MEPLSAVSLCGNIIQFAEFGVKAFKAIRETLNHGELSRDAHVARHATKLVELTDYVLSGCSGFLLKFEDDLNPKNEEAIDVIAASDALLQAVAQDCRTMAIDVQKKFADLKVPLTTDDDNRGRCHKTWNAFYTTMRRIWAESEVEEMISQLESSKSMVQTTILTSIRYSLVLLRH